MADPSSRTQITVAIIGVIGVLAAALIAKWPQPGSTPGSASDPQHQVAAPDAGRPAPGAAFHPSPPVRPDPLDTTVDNVRILKASPLSGASLQQGQQVEFSVLVEYNLTTLDTAIIYIGLVQYRNTQGCVSGGDIPTGAKVMATRGIHNATVRIPWNVGVSKDVTAHGSVGYEATIMSEQGVRIRGFPKLAGYCYSF